jgi:hypothetical protein
METRSRCPKYSWACSWRLHSRSICSAARLSVVRDERMYVRPLSWNWMYQYLLLPRLTTPIRQVPRNTQPRRSNETPRKTTKLLVQTRRHDLLYRLCPQWRGDQLGPLGHLPLAVVKVGLCALRGECRTLDERTDDHFPSFLVDQFVHRTGNVCLGDFTLFHHLLPKGNCLLDLGGILRGGFRLGSFGDLCPDCWRHGSGS